MSELVPEPDDHGVVDVAIVGAGPVGTALAILLAQHGRSVTLLERWPAPYQLPRAVHFDHEIGRILQACGLGDALAAISEPAEVYEWRNGAGVALLRFGRTGTGASGWPQSSMFNQPELERLLQARAESLPAIEIRRGCEVTGLAPERDGVLVHHRSEATAGVTSTRARYVVGCDGANSTVRGLIGATVHDLGFYYDWLIVDVRLHESRVFDPINVQICDPVRPCTAVSGGPGRRRWEFMRLPDEDIAALDDEKVAWDFLEPWDIHPSNATLERHAVYTFQARWAESWREGRVFLAGDAAHQMPPFAGQGMCSGLRDAANLAWKLDLVLGGQAPEPVLDTYEAERQPNVRSVIDFSMDLGRVICVPDPEEAAARDEAMRAGVIDGEVSEVPELPGISEGLVHVSPGAGELFVQGIVDGRNGPQLFDDAMGVGFRLFVRAGGPGELPLDLLRWFEGLGGAVVVAEGASEAWLIAHDVVAALQRPDFYVFGTAGRTDEVIELLEALRGELAVSLV